MVVGQKVEWVSGGTIKEGEIVAIVPSSTAKSCKNGMDIYRDLNLVEQGFSFHSYGGGCPRNEISYLVALHEPKKKRVISGKIYWPRASQLEKILSYKN
jgi:hypothetical protein